jgi:hypothetical protein
METLCPTIFLEGINLGGDIAPCTIFIGCGYYGLASSHASLVAFHCFPAIDGFSGFWLHSLRLKFNPFR